MYRIIQFLSCLSILTACGTLRADVNLRWLTADSSLPPLLSSYLSRSNVIPDFVRMVDENFVFEQPLTLELGLGDHPHYNRASNSIVIPFSYLERAAFTQSVVSSEIDSGESDELDANANANAVAVFEYTLYHLLGHSLVVNANAMADSTVEALSSYIMIAYWPNGAEKWATAIEAYGNASQNLDGPLDDYWHTHQLFKERQNTIECWILGSEVAQITMEEGDKLLEQDSLPEGESLSEIEGALPQRGVSLMQAQAEREKTERCRDSWNNLVDAAQLLLEPFLLSDSPLGRSLSLR